jgi:small conductance mechanosensitive channel
MGWTLVQFVDWLIFTFLPNALLFIVAFFFACFLTWLLPLVVSAFLSKTGADTRHVRLAEMFTGIVVFTAGFVLSLQVAGIDIIGISITLGAAGIAVGIAVRDVCANTIAALIIQSMEHYQEGALIRVDGRTGFVVEIGLQQTKLVMFESEKITSETMFIPNSSLLDTSVGVLETGQQSQYRLLYAQWKRDRRQPERESLI